MRIGIVPGGIRREERVRRVPALTAVFVILLACSAASKADVPLYRGEPSGEYLKTWLLCGPFPLDSVPEWQPDVIHLPGFQVDFLEGHGGETKPTISEGTVVAHGGVEAAWFRYTTPLEYEIDLDEAVSDEEPVIAYAYCEVEAAAQCACILAVGSNDGVRVWLNGERIWDVPAGRGLIADQDLVPVVLRKGRNSLLLKVEERGNQWGFCARFLPFDTRSFADRFPLFRIMPQDDGATVLQFLQSPSVAAEIIDTVHLVVVSAAAPAIPVWQGDWTKKRKMALPLDPDVFDQYLLHVDGRLTGGTEWTLTLPFSAGKRTIHMLFEDGKTDYAIVVGAGASDSERWAADELQRWLREASGAEFAIRSDAEPLSAHEIVLGVNGHSRALLDMDTPGPEANDESFCYKNAGPSIVIVGGSARGTMYGVMTFLERELGCRWYTPRVTVIPKKTHYGFDRLYHREAPGIRVRNDFYYEAFDPTWAARNKINGAMSYRDQPGGVECYWGVHTTYPLMPPSEFYGEHPEYYSLIDGKRIHERAQLCLTNPDVLRIVTERVKKIMREQPQYLIYSVSQNDWANPCQCEKCQAIVEREGSESGPLIAFVNQVAEAVESEFPDKYIGTLAYQYTRKPCKTLKPRENVVIRLCSIECCFAHDFHHCPENASFVEDLEGWATISPHLYIWDYVVNFSHYIMPYPNFRVLQENIKAFRDNKAIGIMEQAAYQSRGGEFAELRAYVLAKLLWDPECDVDRTINDFMCGYYGRAGQHVRRYFDLLHNRITPDTHIHLGLRAEDKLFSDAFIRDAEALFDQAEAAADTEELRQRVEVARLPLMYLKCKRAPVEAKFDGTYSRFCSIVARESITHYAESGETHRRAFHESVEAAK